MGVSGTPKLLFHGTAALTAYLSYQTGKTLEQIYQQKPRTAINYIGDHPDREYFKAYGPGYPYTGFSNQNTRFPEICLASNPLTAFNFAKHWQARPVSETRLQLTNSFNRKVFVTEQNYSSFPEVQGTYLSIAGHLFAQAKESATPGAILLISGEKLSQTKLMRNSKGTEESVLIDFLPWGFIRGALLINTGERKISAYLFRDNNVAGDLLSFLHNWDKEGNFVAGYMDCELVSQLQELA